MLVFSRGDSVVTVAKCDPRGTARAHVDECVKADRCLICDSKAGKRGLCQLHFSQWYSLARKMSDEERAAYEAASIQAGKLLPSRQGRRGRVNAFEDLAAGARKVS